MIFGDTAFKAETGKFIDLKKVILDGKFKFPHNI